MPQAKGLLRRAIIQSGTSALTPEKAQGVTRAAISDGARTFVYRFGYRSSAMDNTLGATHPNELHTCSTLPTSRGCAATRVFGPDAAPIGLASRMHGAWVAFARNGNPGWLDRTDESTVQLVV